MMASAFCPAHITGFFKAELEGKDPNYLGSLGAGFSIQKGVKTRVILSSRNSNNPAKFHIQINGFKTGDVRVSEYVLNEFLVDNDDYFVDVIHELDVPVGYGLGCSAAVASSLALALNQVLNAGYSKTEVAQIAHLAEIRCKTGLGDVLASYHGGFEIRTKSGAPGFGELEKIDPKEKLDALIVCFNPISTKKFLGEKISLVNGLGGKMVQELIKSKDINDFQDKSIKFAKYIKVVTPKMSSVASELRKNGIKCGVALFGETIFSLVPSSEKKRVLEILEKYDGLVLSSKIDNSGARLD
jgi:pantoate kinase